jgi:hypothetical protein
VRPLFVAHVYVQHNIDGFVSWTVHLVSSHTMDKSKCPLGKTRHPVSSVLVVHVDIGQVWLALSQRFTLPIAVAFVRGGHVFIQTTGFHQFLALLISCKETESLSLKLRT